MHIKIEKQTHTRVNMIIKIDIPMYNIELLKKVAMIVF